MRVTFFVPGKPIPQGSKNIMNRGGKSWLVDQNVKNLREWRTSVNLKAREHWKAEPETDDVGLILRFVMPRPKNHYTAKGNKSKLWRRYLKTKPDIDKLTRAVLDALTGVLYVDDSQVSTVYAVKEYCEKESEGAGVCIIFQYHSHEE